MEAHIWPIFKESIDEIVNIFVVLAKVQCIVILITINYAYHCTVVKVRRRHASPSFFKQEKVDYEPCLYLFCILSLVKLHEVIEINLIIMFYLYFETYIFTCPLSINEVM